MMIPTPGMVLATARAMSSFRGCRYHQHKKFHIPNNAPPVRSTHCSGSQLLSDFFNFVLHLQDYPINHTGIVM